MNFVWNPAKKKKYLEAVENKRRSERNEANHRTELNKVKSKLSSCKSRISEYKCRLEQIKDIIDLMTKSGTLFKKTVPGEIEDTKKDLNKVNTSYSSCIRANGIESGSIIETFEFETVPGNRYSSAALAEYIKEKENLESKLARETQNKTNYENQIESLKAAIRRENNIQLEAWAAMLKNCC